MRKKLTALLLSLAVSTVAADFDGKITVTWNYPTNELSGTTFRLYSSTNALAPLSSWPVVAAVEGTNAARLTMPTPQNFFVCTASNFWGESNPSAVVSTPALARDDVNLSIIRGH